MKIAILALGTLSFLLVTSARANELDDAYQKLKDAQTAKDADAVKKAAVETAKLAKAEATGPKLEGFSEEDWPKRVDYAKGLGTLSEYALATTAAQAGLLRVEPLGHLRRKPQHVETETRIALIPQHRQAVGE